MEFFYTDEEGTEQGPFTERQMADWIREYPNTIGEDRKIRFNINGKEFNPTLARMRARNGHCTPLIFAKCERVDKEKELWKEIEEAAREMQRIDSIAQDVQKTLSQNALDAGQLISRLQRKVDAVTAQAERIKRELEIAAAAAAAAPPPAVQPMTIPDPPSTKPADPNTSKPSKRLLPLIDVSSTNDDEEEIEEGGDRIKTFRDSLTLFNLDEAQKKLKFPIYEKCRGCGGNAVAENDLRSWLCHITSKNHIDKFRQRGGRVTQRCLDYYPHHLSDFPNLRANKREDERAVEEDTVDLEKKKLDYHGGVIMLPATIPLLHIDPSDTTKISAIAGMGEMDRLRKLVYGPTDRYGASKSFYLPSTNCDVCNQKFDYAPHIVPHLLTKIHIDKYLARRGSFSRHDFAFWTDICKLFPEEGKDTRNQKEVRSKLKEMGRNLDISTCKDSQHLAIYGGEDRRRHVLEFIKKQLIEHQRPVVVYMKTIEAANDLIVYLMEQLPETRIGHATSEEDSAELEVIVSATTLRLTRPHAIAFLSAPLDPQQKASYAQKMCGEFVEANLIVAFGFDEQSELRKFSRQVIAYPQTHQKTPPTVPTVVSVEPTVPPTAPTVSAPVSPTMPTVPPPPRVSPPIASIPPFNSVTAPPRSEPYPTVPPNQRRYDPSQDSYPTVPTNLRRNDTNPAEPKPGSPKTPEGSKKCALM